MSHQFKLARLVCLPLLLATTPLAAQTAGDVFNALDDENSAAISVGFDGEQEEARSRLLAVAVQADKEAANVIEGNPLKGQFLELAGISYYYAAQNHDPEWDDEAGQAKEIEWLSAALERLEPARQMLGEQFEANYEYRGVAGQLWQHGHRLDDPRWREWSAARVMGNRLMLAWQPDAAFEMNMLAEAEALAAAIPKDDLRYGVRSKRQKVAGGKAPYSPPGR